MVLKHWTIALMVLLLPTLGLAQVEEGLEQWVEETGETGAAADMSDLLIQLHEQPVNINDTHTVAALPFVSPFQARALANYILLHGQLQSLKELRFVPGFDSAMVELLNQVATAEPYTVRTAWHLTEGRHQVVTTLGGTAEQAEGYRNGHYEGDNLHALMLYKYNLHNKIELRVVADKDPAEAWGKSNYYGYHLMLREVGRMEKLILGRYCLQFGQGLTLWTGLRPFNLTGATPLRYGAGVRAAPAFYEEGYQEGVATQVNLGRGLHASAFGSRLEGETLAGTHVEYRRGNLILGLTAAYTALDDSLGTSDYVYNQNRFHGNQMFNGGMDFVWQWRRMTFYGEGAVDGDGNPAAIGGLTVKADSRNRFGVSYRHYSDRYHNLHAQGYAIGTVQGERGVTLDAESRLPLGFTLLASLDLHRFPTLRYATYHPSSGQWLRLQVSRPLGRHFGTSLRYTYRQKERNIPNLDTALYLGEETLRQQLQGEVTASFGQWVLKVRGVAVDFDSEQGEAQRGWLASVSARYTRDVIQMQAAATWFDVDGYYARIYLGESNLQYAWSMPALYGRGLRAHTVVRWRLDRHLTLAAKYALTYMPQQEAIGNGDSRTDGPLRQTWLVQLRTTF